jgi:ubiquinone/menaquinone biosynthesis C-methylase UbiE
MLAHLLLERQSRRPELPRIPEPALVMDDLAQNAAFALAGREDGSLAFLYLYHALQITPLLCPGDQVLDLGCGPANQLAQIARLNPEARFTGLDASRQMLERAEETVARCQLANIALQAGDMTTLNGFADAAFDGVISTMSLHHLPDFAALAAAMRAAQRVLKPGGSLYLVDFGRFKRAATQRFFAADRSDNQPEALRRDYFNSMQAAFSVAELRQATAVFGGGIACYTTALAPFMVVIKSSERRSPDDAVRQTGRAMYAQMSAALQKDFRLYTRWFQSGGLTLPFRLY